VEPLAEPVEPGQRRPSSWREVRNVFRLGESPCAFAEEAAGHQEALQGGAAGDRLRRAAKAVMFSNRLREVVYDTGIGTTTDSEPQTPHEVLSEAGSSPKKRANLVGDASPTENPLPADRCLLAGLVRQPSSSRLARRRRPRTSSAASDHGSVASQFTTVSHMVASGRLRLWSIWTERPKDPILDRASPSGASGGSAGALGGLNAEGRPVRSGDVLVGNSPLQRWITKPSSQRRIAWDLTSFWVMGYDLIFIPLQAFDLEASAFSIIMGYVTTVFWTLDVIWSFFVGYHDAGIIEMRPKQIAKRYLRTWFPIDFSVAALDWAFILTTDDNNTESTAGLLRVSKSLKIARVLRLFRLLRFMKVLSVMGEFRDLVSSESLLTMLGIMKMTAGIAVVNHFIACAWYAIGIMNATSDPNSSWVSALELEKPGEELTFPYRYSSALHWSLTQFTPASMEVVPRNAFERLFTICVIIFALVMFSSFVSSITQMMTKLHAINLEQFKQQEYLKRYIIDNKLSLELGNRINAFARSCKTNRRRLHENDIPILQHMPPTLRAMMRSEVYLPVLSPHPLFRQVLEVDEYGIGALCMSAMSQRHLQRDHELFIYGEKATQMFFLVSGELEYYLAAAQSAPQSVEAGSNFGEMALWVNWDHRGRMVSTSSSACELVTLDSEAFRATAAKSLVLPHCQAYARLYVEKLMTEHAVYGRFVSDTWGSFETQSDLVQMCFEKIPSGLHMTSEGSSTSRLRRRSRTLALLRSFSPLHGGSSSAVDTDQGLSVEPRLHGRRSNTWHHETDTAGTVSPGEVKDGTITGAASLSQGENPVARMESV